MIESFIIISEIEVNDSSFNDLFIDKNSSYHNDSSFLISDNILILNKYFKLDINNMMKFIYDHIIMIYSRKEKKKYR